MDPVFSERIYRTITRRVNERTQRGLTRTKSKYEAKLSNLRQAVRTADHTTRRKYEMKLKQCEKELGVGLQRLEQESVSYLEKLGVRPGTGQDKQDFEGSNRPQTTYATLLDRPGSRSWAKTASGGKMRGLLSETLTTRTSPKVTNWDTFVGYKGPPFAPRATLIDIATLAPRDTQQFMAQDKYREYGTNMNTICRKELPRHAKKATAAQALLYLKLREDKYTKDEAIKHSSNITFKTDSGLHQLKGTTDPFMFNGLHVRVPVSDPDNRFKPVSALEDHKDFDMLSEAYEKFMKKYTVSNGEFEPNAAFFSPRHHTQFRQEKPPTAPRLRKSLSESKKVMLQTKVKPLILTGKKEKRTQSEALVTGKKGPILVDVQPSEMMEGVEEGKVEEEKEVERLLPTNGAQSSREMLISSFPSEDVLANSLSQSPARPPIDTVSRVEESKGGTITFRCIDPKFEFQVKSSPKKQKSFTHSSTLGEASSSPRVALTDEIGRDPESFKTSPRTLLDTSPRLMS